MHGGFFYHQSLRKYTLLLSNLFSNIYVSRGDNYRLVPITITSKEHFVAALNNRAYNDESGMASVATMLPRIGIQMVAMNYDATRKTNPSNRKTTRNDDAPRPALNRLFNAVPYDFEFEISIYTRHQDDAYQIIEQIIPYFTPQFNCMIKELDENEVTIDERDIPIILESVVPEETLEGAAGDMRRLEYSMALRMKGWVYPPTNAQYGEIRTIYLDFNDEETVLVHAEREEVTSVTEVVSSIRNLTQPSVVDISWNSAIENTTIVAWNRQEYVGTAVDVDWNMQSYVNETTDVAWSVRTELDSVVDVEWRMFNEINEPSSIDVTWTTLAQIESDSVVDINWSVREAVNPESVMDVSWNYQSLAAEQSVSVSWETLN